MFFLFALAFAAARPAAGADDYAGELAARAREMRLAERPEWLRLLHYRRGLFGDRASLADGKSFFLAPRGKTRPGEELEATLRAFFEPFPENPDVLHAQCRFPARYAWLKEELGFDAARLPEAPCGRFESWREKVQGQAVTAVFASAYLNNPASLYGHTFLRVGPAERDRAALNDYTVNFAANTADRNGVAFAVKGLLGLYPGTFTVAPYYMKVQQYNNIESRDLWEYELSLTPEQTERLVRHLWELGSTHFDYFFLTENCSFQLLPLLEAAAPELDVSRGFRFKAVPADTIRALAEQPGLVLSRRRRPSQMRLLLARRARLNREELLAAERIARRREEAPFPSLDDLPPERAALVLESAYDYFRYRHKFRRYQPREADEFERRLLTRRGALGVPQIELDVPLADGEAPPEDGHGTGRIAAGYGFDGEDGFEELSLRPALHDFEADSDGFAAGTQLEMFHLVLRRHEGLDETYLESFGLIDVMSVTPLDRWVRRPSWKISAGWKNAPELGRAAPRGTHFSLRGGSGAAWSSHLLGRGELVYAMADMEGAAGAPFRDGYRAGAGASAGVALRPAKALRLRLEGGWMRYPAGDVRNVTRGEAASALSLGRDWELRAVARRRGNYRETLFSVARYL